MIYTIYANHDDITFIMKETKNSLSVIGFYFGEPNEESTKLFSNKLTATFDKEVD